MFRFAILLLLIMTFSLRADELFGTDPLTEKGDLAVKMIKGIDSYLDRELKKSASVKPQRRRERLRELLGLPENITVNRVNLLGGFDSPIKIAESDIFEVFAVRWPAMDGIVAEGLLIEPKKMRATAQAIAIPDADQIPEDIVGLTETLPKELQFARILGELRIRVIVPTLISSSLQRRSEIGRDRPDRMSDREILQRMVHPLGKNLIGYEVQKVAVAAEFLSSKSTLPIGIIGTGEGAVIAFYSATSLSYFSAVSCIGYAGPTSEMHGEDFSRQVWAIRKEFGLSGLWDLLGDSPFCIGFTYPNAFRVSNELKKRSDEKSSLAPVEHFLDEYDGYIEKSMQNRLVFNWRAVNISRPEWMKKTILILMGHLSLPTPLLFPERLSELIKINKRDYIDGRHDEQFQQILKHLREIARVSEADRIKKFQYLEYKSAKEYSKSVEPLRKQFEEEFVGKLPSTNGKFNAKSRVINEASKWTAYEVTLDMYDEIFASGTLLMPKGIKPREKRPVIVCQHGEYATPREVCGKTKSSANSFGSRLADLGYIVFAPLSPTVVEGAPNFEMIFRKAHPVKLTLFSFILRQHETILEWLPIIPQVDAKNIGLYGFGYGGKTALRIGAILTKYKFVICSGEFTEGVGKAISTESAKDQVFLRNSDVFEFNSANTFSHAEMANMIAPRPFMVERGHDDDSSRDEMVAYEYAKVKYHYSKRLGFGDRTEIEFFDGPRSVKGEGTFRFIQKHTDWPMTEE